MRTGRRLRRAASVAPPQVRVAPAVAASGVSGRVHREEAGDRRLRLRAGAAVHLALLINLADFGLDRLAVQQRVDRGADIALQGDAGERLDFHQRVEGRRGFAFEHGFAGAAPARLFVGEGHGLDAADQVREGGVEHQVGERVAVRGGDQLDAALGDRAGGQGLQLGADFVDHDHLGHVVFDGFNHDGVLPLGGFDLHAAGAPDAGVGDIAVAGDFVGGIDDHDALALLGQHAGGLAQEGRLAHAGAAQQEDARAGGDQVLDQRDRAGDGAADAHGEADDFALSVAQAGDAVQGARDAGAVVVAELAQVAHDLFQLGGGDLGVGQFEFALAVARARPAAEVEHDFQQGVEVVFSLNRAANRRRQRLQQRVYVAALHIQRLELLELNLLDRFGGGLFRHGPIRFPAQPLAAARVGSAPRSGGADAGPRSARGETCSPSGPRIPQRPAPAQS